MEDIEKDPRFIKYDFQGWPIFKLTFKEFLEGCGFKYNSENNTWTLNNDEILNSFVETVEDDGMAYGINEKFVSEVDILEDNQIRLWIE